MLIKDIYNLCYGITFNRLLLSFVDTLFLIIFFISIIHMNFNTYDAIIQLNGYEKLPSEEHLTNLNFIINTESLTEKYYYQVNENRTKAIEVMWNMFFIITPAITFLYLVFYLLFKKRKDLNKIDTLLVQGELK